jgi:hypothetical protein
MPRTLARLSLAAAAALCSVGARSAEARLDPLRALTHGPLPEVVIVLDTSPAMSERLGGASGPSRLELARRALQAVLPELLGAANFALVASPGAGQHAYEEGAGPSRQQSLFLGEWEMRAAGSWTLGRAWDRAGDRPAARFRGPDRTTLYTLTPGDSSLYRRENSSGVSFSRRAWSGRLFFDGAATWRYAGSYYSYQAPGGDPTRPMIFTTFRGPRFVERGRTWVYQRHDRRADRQGPRCGGPGRALHEPLVEAGPATSAAALEDQMGRLLNRLNPASSGGLHPAGGCGAGLGEAIDAAAEHLVERAEGRAPAFTSSDPAWRCRPRLILVIAAGGGPGARSPADAARRAFARTVTIGAETGPLRIVTRTLGIAAAGVLDRVADYGDDGLANGSAHALTATSLGDLIENIRSALLDTLRSEHAAAPSSSTSVTTGSKSVAVIPSFEHPGWSGHLRAIDFSRPCAAGCAAPATSHAGSGFCQLWDARDRLESIISKGARRLYTGYPGLDGNRPFPIATWNGRGWTVNLVGVRSVWARQGPVPADDQIVGVVQWLMQKRLGPLVSSVPASVAAPPGYSLSGPAADHADFVIARKNREPMIYVASNDGILHGFRARNGDELFGYVPPFAWPRIHELYQRGGQPAAPSRFLWVLAGSPRVEDNRVGPGTWRTELLLPAGPGGGHFSVIDVTDPGQCDEPSLCTTFAPASPPFRMVTSSTAIAAATRFLGETWSLPALFCLEDCRLGASMGSGYRTGRRGQNEYHTFFGVTWPGGWPRTTLRIAPSAGFRVGDPAQNYAVLADTSALVDLEGNRRLIASYQATLNGTVIRYGPGTPASASFVIGPAEAGPAQPFHHAAAVLYRTGGAATVAALSGSALEEHPYMWDPALGFESKIYLRREQGGSVEPVLDKLTRSISSICTPSAGYLVPAGACPDGPPSGRARPVTDPVLLGDIDLAGGHVELLALYQDLPPPAAPCDPVSSWLVHLKSDGPRRGLVKAVKLAGTRLTGLAILGSPQRREIIFSAVQRSGAGSTVKALGASPQVGGAGQFGAAILESWREVP